MTSLRAHRRDIAAGAGAVAPWLAGAVPFGLVIGVRAAQAYILPAPAVGCLLPRWPAAALTRASRRRSTRWPGRIPACLARARPDAGPSSSGPGTGSCPRRASAGSCRCASSSSPRAGHSGAVLLLDDLHLAHPEALALIEDRYDAHRVGARPPWSPGSPPGPRRSERQHRRQDRVDRGVPQLAITSQQRTITPRTTLHKIQGRAGVAGRR